jgi:hypothetical protein
MVHQNHEDEKNSSEFFEPLERQVISNDFSRAHFFIGFTSGEDTTGLCPFLEKKV